SRSSSADRLAATLVSGPLPKAGGPDRRCGRKGTSPGFFDVASDAPQLPRIFSTQGPVGRRRHDNHRGGGAVAGLFGSESPEPAPYKEWLGIVGSMLVAVLICAVLFAGGVLT